MIIGITRGVGIFLGTMFMEYVNALQRVETIFFENESTNTQRLKIIILLISFVFRMSYLSQARFSVQYDIGCLLTMSAYSWDWKEFDPKIGQADKRERDGIVSKGVKFVKKNLNELGLSSYAAVPVVDRTSTIKEIVHVYPPNSPLEAFLTSKENKKFMKGLNKAIEDTQMWALELWDMKEKVDLDNDEEARLKFKEIVGESESEEEVDDDEVKIVKPDKPIFALTADEVAVFFDTLLKNLYEIEGIKEYKLWAKKVNGETMKTATKLDHYDKKAEEILPRDSYIGRGSGGPNIGNMIKLVSAYFLSQFNINHNSHARTIPSNYRTVDIDFENYDDLITNPKNKRRPIKSRAEKAKKRQLEKASEEENSDEETSKTKKGRPNETSRPSTPYRPSTLARQSSFFI